MAPGFQQRDSASSGTVLQRTPSAASFQRVLSSGCLHARLPKTSSLVFDLEMEEASHTADDAEASGLRAEVVHQMRKWLLPSEAIEMQLFSDVEDALDHCSMAPAGSAPGVVCAALQASDQQCDLSQALAASLQQQGYHVSVRTALGGGEGQECLRNLRHTFVNAWLPGPRGSSSALRPYVIDPKFKEQFEIAKPTPRYAAVLEALPEVLVIAEANIPPLVNFLCTEIHAAFKANQSVLPPWRHAGSMLSKWMPRKSVDEPVVATQHGGASHQPAPAAVQGAKPLACEPRTRHVGGNFMTVSAGL